MPVRTGKQGKRNMANIELRPTYWASISGGKDSPFMLYYILKNLDRYPLDGVVHFELEMDFPFIHDVVDEIEKECNKLGIPIFRIKPRRTWDELYNKERSSGYKYLYPTRLVRWCNDMYKLDCDVQLRQMMKSQGKKVIYYIGFCINETKRFRFQLGEREPNVTQIYPLAENGFHEEQILRWARKQQIFNGYYMECKRCGCMCCPMSNMDSLVYTKTHYPKHYEHYMTLAKETEDILTKRYGHKVSVWGSPQYDTDYKMRRVDEIIESRKYQGKQLNLFEGEIEDELHMVNTDNDCSH